MGFSNCGFRICVLIVDHDAKEIVYTHSDFDTYILYFVPTWLVQILFKLFIIIVVVVVVVIVIVVFTLNGSGISFE